MGRAFYRTDSRAVSLGLGSMIFTKTPLKGSYVVELEKHEDERGYFARTFCAKEFAALGLPSEISQCSLSYNKRKGTLRGLHYQAAPHEETKLVRCIQGAIFDAIVDLRSGSETYGKWFAIELSSENGKSLYIPKGFAHGFLSLTDDATLLYQISCDFVAESARTIRWNDPTINIHWPQKDGLILSEKDKNAPLLTKP